MTYIDHAARVCPAMDKGDPYGKVEVGQLEKVSTSPLRVFIPVHTYEHVLLGPWVGSHDLAQDFLFHYRWWMHNELISQIGTNYDRDPDGYITEYAEEYFIALPRIEQVENDIQGTYVVGIFRGEQVEPFDIALINDAYESQQHTNGIGVRK